MSTRRLVASEEAFRTKGGTLLTGPQGITDESEAETRKTLLGQ
jgi:hypothetical protein